MKYYLFEIPIDCEQALKELKKLAVCKIKNDDIEENFADVWYHVQHEIDMFEEGEETELKYSTCMSAKKWLLKYKHLYEKYNTK